MKRAVQHLFDEQLQNWSLAATNYAALGQLKLNTFSVGGNTFRVQFNPARILSTAANVDPQSIRERACFLCAGNRPAVQREIPFRTEYAVLVNPYPLFPRHLTIPSVSHTPQSIGKRTADMLDLAAELDDFVVFYNGPRCGASAPDHAHFQAGSKGFLPFEKEWKQTRTLLREAAAGMIWKINDGLRSGWVIEGQDRSGVDELFATVCTLLAELSAEEEPMLNALAWREAGIWTVVVFARRKHRPDCFFAEGESGLTVSPAAVDLGGVFILPLEKDMGKITPELIRGILHEVGLDKAGEERITNRLKERI